MKRIVIVALAVSAIGAATLALAQSSAQAPAAKAPAAKAPATRSLKGEIVDTGCYLGHEAKGEKHISCATKCIANGMPMGLLTADGKLYLLTLDHDNADPYNQAKTLAGKQVEVTGVLTERAGMKGIDVQGIKAL